VGAGIAIKRPGTPTVKLMYRMDNRCSNNQAQAFAILKALKYIQTTQANEEDKAVTVHTDSMTTLDSLIKIVMTLGFENHRGRVCNVPEGVRSWPMPR